LRTFSALPFSTQYYFHRSLFYLTTPLFVVLLYFFGGNPEHFDYIYIAALVLSCVFCWSDKDTLGALAILLGLWGLSQVIYMLPSNTYSLMVVYALCLVLSVAFLDQITAKVTLIVTLYSIGAEMFWWHIEYANKPQIHYLVGLLALTGLARELLFKRVIYMSEYLGIHSGKVALDWQVRWVLLIGYSFLLAVILEYFVRHLTEFSNVTIFYYQFEIAAQTLSTITLALIYMHYFHNQAKKHLAA
jgi:hypothetical protein